MPEPVATEVRDDPAAERLAAAVAADDIRLLDVEDLDLRAAAGHLDRTIEGPDGDSDRAIEGDIALLAAALSPDEAGISTPVVVTDDRPLRNACKALSVPVSGTIGVLIRAVEQGTFDRETAMEKLYAMDEVGARLSASLLRRAERLIDEAAGK